MPIDTSVKGQETAGCRRSPYATLLSYAWHNDYCFPGQERLAEDMGVSDRSVRTYLKELEEAHLLTVQQRGQGKPNLYQLDLTVKLGKR